MSKRQSLTDQRIQITGPETSLANISGRAAATAEFEGSHAPEKSGINIDTFGLSFMHYMPGILNTLNRGIFVKSDPNGPNFNISADNKSLTYPKDASSEYITNIRQVRAELLFESEMPSLVPRRSADRIFATVACCKYAKPVLIHGSRIYIPVSKRPSDHVHRELMTQHFNPSKALLSALEAPEIQRLKRTLREWPTCEFGGSVNVIFKHNGGWMRRAHFVCSMCST